MSERKLLLLAG